MDAENAAMTIAAKHDIPVPKIYGSDTSKTKYPVRFQLLELLPYKCLNDFYKNGSLDRYKTGREVGRYLARLHKIKANGFGFFDTEKLRATGEISGLDKSHRDYFLKKLNWHLSYLRDCKFLSKQEVDEIEFLLDKHLRLVDVAQGSLVHKDLAYWNVLGTNKEVKAIIDWDDCVIGDPVDDLSILKCFYSSDVLDPVLEGYCQERQLPDDFDAKLGLYLVRNMLWKAVIRDYMGYFDMDDSFFIINDENSDSLKQFTYDRLFTGVDVLRNL